MNQLTASIQVGVLICLALGLTSVGKPSLPGPSTPNFITIVADTVGNTPAPSGWKEVPEKVAWDDVRNKRWPTGFERIQITSSADNTPQPCMVYRATKPDQPLVVSLHSWSGYYTQADSLSGEIRERDWNYIHPHFRGPNWTPQACGSALVVQDIDDAIRFAIKELKADPSEVHVVGASGGGHAAMLCYLGLKYPVKSVSSWVGISSLPDWYDESLGRGQRYAKDILTDVTPPFRRLV